MSSIYKKGRDGYYYYQTYVFNKETNKKNKRIFHSLGTKDHQEAREKQIEYDKKYEKYQSIDNKIFKKLSNVYLFPVFAIMAYFIFDIFYSYDFSNDERYKNNEKKAPIEHSVHSIDNIYKTENELKRSLNDIKEVISKEKNLTYKDTLNDLNLEIKSRGIVNQPEPVIPNYNIEKVEKISGPFKQAKIYITIKEGSSKQSQLLLCDIIKKRYSEFSNIVICLYKDNKDGKNLANGNDEKVSIQEKKESWLAMFTYNAVEGEFFNDNPTGYLGSYKN